MMVTSDSKAESNHHESGKGINGDGDKAEEERNFSAGNSPIVYSYSDSAMKKSRGLPHRMYSNRL